jgi:dephospho-CoA kinase
MVIGITGYLSAGKGLAAEYLEKQHGFINRGYGDTIREEMRQNGIELGRDNEYAYAAKKRADEGFGYWSKKIVDSIKPGENVVVEGIRNIKEIDELSRTGNFHLIFVDAPIETRFARMQERSGRPNDPKTMTEFEEKENRERSNPDPMMVSIDPCVKLAEYTVENGGDKQTMYNQLDKIVEEIKNGR